MSDNVDHMWGTFEEIMIELRRIHDEYGILTINISYATAKKPLLALVVDNSTTEGDEQP
jgi:hypothetical protein